MGTLNYITKNDENLLKQTIQESLNLVCLHNFYGERRTVIIPNNPKIVYLGQLKDKSGKGGYLYRVINK